MAAQPEEMKSSGSRLNVNFGKLRISQNEAARMFNRSLDHVHRLWVWRRPARPAFQRRNEFTRRGLVPTLRRRLQRMTIRYVEDPGCLDRYWYFCFYGSR